MPRFPVYHTSDRNIGTVDFSKNRPANLSIPVGHRYERFDCRLVVELANGGAPAADMVQEGLLALIEKMYIQQNGGDERYITDGRHIHLQSFKQMGQEPYGFNAPSLAAGGVYEIGFQYRFDPTQLSERSRFTLDLLNEANNPDAITYANLEVRWGAVESVFNTVGGMEVVSARLEVEAIEQKLTANAYRSAELVTRKMTFPFTTAQDLEREIIRVTNSQLIGLAIVQTENGVQSDFADDTKRISLRDDDYNWHDRPLWRYQQMMTLERREAVPANMIFINLTEGASVRSALHDGRFSENLNLKVPVNLGGGAVGNEITVYAEYAKVGSLT